MKDTPTAAPLDTVPADPVPPASAPGPLPPLALRAPGETPRALAAFIAYFELGPARSLPELADQTGESLDTLKRWSSRHRWAERLAALLSGEWQQRLAASAAAHARSAEEWQHRAAQFREQQWATAQQLLGAVHCFLESVGESHVERMTLSQAARAIHIASHVAGQAVRDPVALAAAAPSPVQLELLAALQRAYGPSPAPPSPSTQNPDPQS